MGRLWGVGYDKGPFWASKVWVDNSLFTGNLSVSDDNVQKALETIDGLNIPDPDNFLRLDQSNPQTMTGLSDGFLKLVSGVIGTGTVDLSDYFTKTEIGNQVTSKDFRHTGAVSVTYDGDFVDEVTVNGRTIDFTNDGTDYTKWEDPDYEWTPSYDADGRLTGIGVDAK